MEKRNAFRGMDTFVRFYAIFTKGGNFFDNICPSVRPASWEWESNSLRTKSGARGHNSVFLEDWNG